MIEYLALAAEVTAVLLIISIAYPTTFKQRAKTDASARTHSLSSEPELCQASLESVRILAYQSTAAQIEKYTSADAWLQTDAHRETTEAILGVSKLLEERDLDSLCRLPTLKSLERQLSETRTLRQHLDLPLYAAVMSIDKWSEIAEQNGPVSAERLLREIATRLSAKLSLHGTVIRYSDYAFGIGLFGLTSSQATQMLLAIKSIFDSSKIAVGENEVQVTFSMAIAPVCDEDFDSENYLQSVLWERLDDGITESITAGGDQLHTFDNETRRWSSNSSEHLGFVAAGILSSIGADISSHSSDVGSVLEDSTSDESSSVSDEPPSMVKELEPPKPSQVPSTSAAVETETKEVVSVASSDDIAALFAAQKAKPKQTPAKASDLDEKTPPNPVRPAVPTEVTQDSAASKASSDDIAALFASMKNTPAKKAAPANVTPTPASATPTSATPTSATPTSATPTSATPTSATPGQPTETQATEEESLVASIDDISALFAAAQKGNKEKSKVNQISPAVPENSSSEPSDSSSDKPASSAPVQSTDNNSTSQAVNADDIESLFAAMRK